MRKQDLFKTMMLTAIFLLGIAFTAKAQGTKGQNPMYVCDDKATRVIALDYDIMGSEFHSNGGYWDYVKNSVTDANAYNRSTDAIKKDVRNVFKLLGKKPGVYKFVFTANSSNACIPNGEKRLATIVILENPKPINHVVTLCPNEPFDLDLKSLVSATLPTPTFTNTSGLVSGTTLKIVGATEGEIKETYQVSYPNATICSGPASITVIVKRDGKAPTYTGAPNISYCITEMPGTLNLNSQLTTVAKGGVWKVDNTTKVTLSSATGATDNQLATFNNPVSGDVYKFTYTYSATSCYTGGTLTFKITVTDDLSNFLPKTEVSKNVCKADNPTQVIDMLKDGLGLAIEASAGTWRKRSVPGGSTVDVSDGLFRVADAIAGKYAYTFEVSTATSLCGLAGKKADLLLEVIDTRVTKDGRDEFCLLDLPDIGTPAPAPNEGNIVLSRYVADTKENTTWTTKDNGFTITGDMFPISELQAKGVGTYTFNYVKTTACGNAEGSVYLTVTDKMDVADAYTLAYCRPQMTTPLDILNAIGKNLPGTWALTTNAGNTGNLNNHIFSENANTKGDKTYVVTLTSTSKCTGNTPKTITITILISDNKYMK